MKRIGVLLLILLIILGGCANSGSENSDDKMLDDTNRTQQNEEENRIFTGQIKELNDNNNFVVETLDSHKDLIAVKITENVTFENNISEKFKVGNIVIFETKPMIKESWPLKVELVSIIANNTNDELVIDDRETISSYINAFPKISLDTTYTEGVVEKEEVISVKLPIPDGYEWLYTIDEQITFTGTGSEIKTVNNEETTYQYWGFRMNEVGEYVIPFVLLGEKGQEGEKVINFFVDVK